MRRLLISALIFSLFAGCSSVHIGPHHIDVQQGNALDQDNVARLKTGLNRSQVRFLLGTPLIVDPFRTDRWDYVYLYYKAGKLTEQKHITLFFEGDTLARIEGDLPEPAVQPAPPAAEPRPEAQQPAAATPAVSAPPAAPLAAEPAAPPAPVAPTPTPAPVEAAPVAPPVAPQTQMEAPAT
ncbi:MAG TPA: outer membrane protein assembly factor BamE, partial [Steroidobacteraceae bacterium]|nr:outer membrane protein assembly factor BamE [Steroidobacteraceae bacterium]